MALNFLSRNPNLERATTYHHIVNWWIIYWCYYFKLIFLFFLYILLGTRILDSVIIMRANPIGISLPVWILIINILFFIWSILSILGGWDSSRDLTHLKTKRRHAFSSYVLCSIMLILSVCYSSKLIITFSDFEEMVDKDAKDALESFYRSATSQWWAEMEILKPGSKFPRTWPEIQKYHRKLEEEGSIEKMMGELGPLWRPEVPFGMEHFNGEMPDKKIPIVWTKENHLPDGRYVLFSNGEIRFYYEENFINMMKQYGISP